MEKRLIEVEAVVEAAETGMLGLAKRLVLIHLTIAVKVGPSLFIRQNLREKQKWGDGVGKGTVHPAQRHELVWCVRANVNAAIGRRISEDI